jgi:heme-degrading monooxygenase HmoA
MFVILWEFQVKRGLEKTFETVYGPEGDWAQLFRRSPDYRGTRLIADVSYPRRFMTIDYWTSQKSFEVFRAQYESEYAELDRRCESLTESERLLSSFEAPSSEPENSSS